MSGIAGVADWRAGRGRPSDWESAAPVSPWPGQAEIGDRWGAMELRNLVRPRALALPTQVSMFPKKPQRPPGVCTERFQP